MTQSHINFWIQAGQPRTVPEVDAEDQSLIEICRRWLDEPSGQMTVNWPSNTFAATWNLEWTQGELIIRADWSSVVDQAANDLNALGLIKLRVDDFLAEWKPPLDLVSAALMDAGYQPELIVGMQQLSNLLPRLKRNGALY